MSRVVSMARSCAYFVERARRHRRAGRYDEAMTLLWRAKGEFGPDEALEMEMARVYDELECTQEAIRSYLRVLRLNGKHYAEAAFQLSISYAQEAETQRAMSFFEVFAQSDHKNVSEEAASLLYEQLCDAVHTPPAVTKKQRSRALEQRAAQRLQEGQIVAARRNAKHALSLHERPQCYTILACCALSERNGEEAVENAEKAHRLAPSDIQSLCILVDAFALARRLRDRDKALSIAFLRAKTNDDLLAVATEAAKHGADAMTLRLTRRLLKREPLHIRAMQLRACALCNLKRYDEASRLFGRLCVLLPENTICEAYYRMLREENPPQDRLTLGLEVPRAEGTARCVQMVSSLYEDIDEILSDDAKSNQLCRLAAWAMRSPIVRDQAATLALILMGLLGTDAAKEVLYDALTDAQLPDNFKGGVMQTLVQMDESMPMFADIGGRYVRLAATKTADRPNLGERAQRIAQRAADEVSRSFPDAPEDILDIWVNYIERYGLPPRHEEEAFVAALEYMSHIQLGRQVNLHVIAIRHGVSTRKISQITRRMERACKQNNKGENTDEVH